GLLPTPSALLGGGLDRQVNHAAKPPLLRPVPDQPAKVYLINQDFPDSLMVPQLDSPGLAQSLRRGRFAQTVQLCRQLAERIPARGVAPEQPRHDVRRLRVRLQANRERYFAPRRDLKADEITVRPAPPAPTPLLRLRQLRPGDGPCQVDAELVVVPLLLQPQHRAVFNGVKPEPALGGQHPVDARLAVFPQIPSGF